MAFVETDLWVLEIPDDWSADYEEDVVVICDPDELGELAISALRKEQGEVTESDLADFASELIESGHPAESCNVADFDGLGFVYTEQDEEAGELSCREWYLACKAVLFIATYTTEQQHAGLDDSLVDQILDTLVLVE